MNKDFSIDEQLLWGLVRKFVKDARFTLYDRDDLMQEARAVAAYAIKTFDKSKNTKFSSYVYTCVQNHFKDLYKEKGIDISEGEFEVLSECQDIETFEIVQTMKVILNPDEYRVFEQRYLLGCNEFETMKALNKTSYEVKKCLRRILHKYKLIETTQDTILTQRRLTNVWLEKDQTL